ncbi:MAG: hypothetical protein ACW98K_09290, partial [Candidatus Kariarchaeaceae archaeon]
RYNLEFAISRRRALTFFGTWITISLGIYALLLYLTGGVNTYFFLEEGFFYDDRGISWNVTKHLNITIPYDPGVSLLVVSILSGILYATLLTLPPVCTILPATSTMAAATSSTVGKTASVSSSVSAAASAFASTAVCCSTSVVAVVTPSVSVFLGPFVPGLIIGSFILLIYSFYTVVMPRFPVIAKLSD